MSGIKSAHYGNLAFPATQVASSDANTLDDYEEGSWTPVITGTSTAGTATYASQLGSYVKIGRLVHVNALIDWSAHTGTGNMIISGLPFSDGGSAGVPCFHLVGVAIPAASLLTGRTSGTTILLETYPSGGGSVTTLALDAVGRIRLTLTYIA